MGSVEKLLEMNNANFSLGLAKLMPVFKAMLALDTMSVAPI